MIKKIASILGVVALVPLTFVGLAALFNYSSTNYGSGATIGAITAMVFVAFVSYILWALAADNAELRALEAKYKR